jgi:hypothetical protein
MLWIAIPIILVLLLFVLLGLGLWGSYGHLPALVAGQLKPPPRHIERGASLLGGGTHPPYAIEVTLGLDRPVAEVSTHYLSFAIDASRVVGGKWWDPRANRVEWGSGTMASPVFDFARSRLDLLAGTLAPAYLRIDGSESDRIYYDLRDHEDGSRGIPASYRSVMTRSQWDAIHPTKTNL